MVKHMHQAVLNALSSARRPDGWRTLALATSRRPVPARPTSTWSDPHGGSLTSVLNRQIADAQLRLRGLSDPAERQSLLGLIAELRKHQQVDMQPRAVCA